jgi:hypothetical protein
LGADQGSLGADQRSFGSLAGGLGAGNRFALDRLRILESGLVGAWKLEHRSRFIERHLLDVSSLLGMIVCLLIDVARGLLAIDPRLIISKSALLGLVLARAALAPLILGDLFLIDARLLSIAGELLPFTEGLLKIGQALFAGELFLA